VFEIGFAEILIVLVIALVVIGPERLPEVARGLGSMVGKVRAFIDNVRNESSLQKEIAELRSQLDMSREINQVRNIGEELQSSLTAAHVGLRSSFYEQQVLANSTVAGQPASQNLADKKDEDKKDEGELDLAKVQRPTFGREQYEELPPWYHQTSDGALAAKAPVVPDFPTISPTTEQVSSSTQVQPAATTGTAAT
jgi:sec-independent protein translocase protein TatB